MFPTPGEEFNFLSGFAFGGRFWVNIANGRHGFIAGIRSD